MIALNLRRPDIPAIFFFVVAMAQQNGRHGKKVLDSLKTERNSSRKEKPGPRREFRSANRHKDHRKIQGGSCHPGFDPTKKGFLCFLRFPRRPVRRTMRPVSDFEKAGPGRESQETRGYFFVGSKIPRGGDDPSLCENLAVVL